MKPRFLNRYFRAARTISKDEDGIVLIWATILMVAIMALAGLALEASRFRSLKTQMQAGADAIAVSGARELDGSSGAIGRACNAINNMISNTPEGMGTQSAISAATITFYSSLYADTTPTTGAASEMGNVVYTAAGGGACNPIQSTPSTTAKYVGVTVSPASITPFVPIGYTSLSADAFAVAGYDFAVCNMPPVFICNPYEQAGDTNETANNRWMTTVNLATSKRQMMKLSVNGGSGYGPGHFGFLVPPDNCNGANCLKNWIGTRHPNACYRRKTVDLNTGQMQSVFDYFNVRFDMYSGGISKTPDYAPALNVRKGYLPQGNACNQTPVGAATLIIPQFTATATTANNSVNVSNVTPQSTLVAGVAISGPGIAAGTTISSFTSNSITLSQKATAAGTNVTLTVGGTGQQAAGLPRDINMIYNPSLQVGDGQWDCLDYWKIAHGTATAAPTGCGNGTTTATLISRADVYSIENAGTYADRSGPAAPTDPNGETGAAICNPPGYADDTGGGDRRTIYAAIVNCMANASMITGGQTADNIPVAGFGKFFMTEPADSTNQTLYGEMNGAVGLDKNAKNYVQLYR
jgi:hypothetical protein